MDPIVIVGAGISGCVTAYELAKKGLRVILIEKDAQIGGLAKTFHYDDFSFDIGPHRFFTQKTKIRDFIQAILKNDYKIIPRHSEVYFLGRYYSWPLRPKSFFQLPLKMKIKASRDMFFIGLKKNREQMKTFQDYVLTNYGLFLYNAFFKD